METMTLFDGFFWHEIVLLVLGLCLFQIALVVAWIYVGREKSLNQVLVLFAVALVMISYSSLQKTCVAGDLARIEQTAQAVAENPDDPVARAELCARLAKLEGRRLTAPLAALRLAKGFEALRQERRALRVVDQSLQTHPGHVELERARSRLADQS